MADIRYGFKLADIDGETSHDFFWPMVPGTVVEAPGPFRYWNDDPCPAYVGDGLCIALTWAGAQSGGKAARCGFDVTYDQADVLAESCDKVRVRKCVVASGPYDIHKMVRRGHLANLRGADLRGADLRGADLSSANLGGANLYGANLRGANLSGADLSGANLYGANLRGANLRGADLRGADLCVADLSGANLYGANLRGANLSGAIGVQR